MSDVPRDITGYSPRRNYLVLGVAGVLFFAAMGIVSVVSALWNVGGSYGRPLTAAILFGSVWSAFTMLGIWHVLVYYRERLFLKPNAITQHLVVRKKCLPVDEVTSVKWDCMPRIVVRTATNRLTVELSNFTVEERLEIVAYFRETFSPEIQQNWPKFAALHASWAGTAPPAHSIAAALLCVLLLLVFGAVFIYCGAIGMGTHWLAVGAANLLGAVWYLRRIYLHKKQAADVASGERSSAEP